MDWISRAFDRLAVAGSSPLALVAFIVLVLVAAGVTILVTSARANHSLIKSLPAKDRSLRTREMIGNPVPEQITELIWYKDRRLRYVLLGLTIIAVVIGGITAMIISTGRQTADNQPTIAPPSQEHATPTDAGNSKLPESPPNKPPPDSAKFIKPRPTSQNDEAQPAEGRVVPAVHSAFVDRSLVDKLSFGNSNAHCMGGCTRVQIFVDDIEVVETRQKLALRPEEHTFKIFPMSFNENISFENECYGKFSMPRGNAWFQIRMTVSETHKPGRYVGEYQYKVIGCEIALLTSDASSQ